MTKSNLLKENEEKLTHHLHFLRVYSFGSSETLKYGERLFLRQG